MQAHEGMAGFPFHLQSFAPVLKRDPLPLGVAFHGGCVSVRGIVWDNWGAHST